MSGDNCFRKLAITVGYTAFLCVSGAASGRPAMPAEELLKLSLEDMLNVNVSVASLFIESSMQVGSTVTSVSEAQWQSLGARRLSDAIGHLPSTIVLPGNFGAEQIYIRGYGFRNNSGGVATLWDGVALNTLDGSPQFTRQNIQLGTLDQIEMIRGPGSALYGENAFHGVLALSAFESKTDTTRVKADYASNEYYQGGIKHSRSLGQNTRLHFTAAASGQPNQNQRYDYIDPTTSQPANSERELRFDTHTVVLKLTTNPDSKLSYYGGLYIDNNEYENFYSLGTTGSVADRDEGGVDSAFSMLQGGARYRINDHTEAEVKLYYFQQERTFKRTFSLNRDFQGDGDEIDQGANLTVKQSNFLGNTQWSLDLGTRRAEMNDYTRQVTASDGSVVPSLTGPLPFSDLTREIYSVALDAATTLVNGQFQVRYGGRYDDYSDFGSAFSPRLGLIYQHTHDTAVKLLYGHAFRAPNAGEVRGFATIEGGDDIQPETIKTYELVLMKQAALTISEFVLFESHWDDAIVVGPTTTPGQFGKYVNSGSNSAYGAEASFTYQSQPWLATLSGSYVQSANDSTQQDYIAFPKWIVNASIGHHFVEQNIDVRLNNRVHLDAAEGQIANALPDPAPLKNYWRSDLHIAKHFDKQTTLSLDVRNLLNRENHLPSIQPNPSTGGLPDEPFSIKGNVQYEF